VIAARSPGGGHHGDDDGGDHDECDDPDGYPPATALLLGTEVIRPGHAVPIPLDLSVAGRVGVPTRRLRRARRLPRHPGLLRPGAPVPEALMRRRMVRIRVPTWLSTFDHRNLSVDRRSRPPKRLSLDSARGIEARRPATLRVWPSTPSWSPSLLEKAG
jgi:hypothetical protein